MRILPVNAANYYASQRKNPANNQPEPSQKEISFNGITKLLKSQIFADGQKAIIERIANRPGRNKIAGELPAPIFNKIDPSQRKEAIPQIMDAFKLATSFIRNFKGNLARPKTEEEIFARVKMNDAGRHYIDKSNEHRPQIANNLLTEIFRRFNIIGEDGLVNLKFVGKDMNSGTKTFLIEGLPGGDHKYLLKVYPETINPNWHLAKRNGAYAELNAATYWTAREGSKTQKGDFYFGDLDSGFMLTKYIDSEVRPPLRIVDEYKYGMVYDNRTRKNIEINEQHKINGYNVSWSRLAVVNKVKNKNKAARITMDRIKHAGEVVVNKELKMMSDDQLAALGLGRKKRGLVVIDEKKFQQSGLIINKPRTKEYTYIYRAGKKINKELKMMSNDQLAALGLGRKNKQLVVVDEEKFKQSGLEKTKVFNVIKDNRIIRDLGPKKRLEAWEKEMQAIEQEHNLRSQKIENRNKGTYVNPMEYEGNLAGLAMAIKHLPPSVQSECIERCMAFNSPLVNQGLAYVLKYLPEDEAIMYFERLAKTGDKETQVILFNEIPLLSKKIRHKEAKIVDDINVSREDIDPIKIIKYYRIASQVAKPEVMEHLASFMHMLPSSAEQHYYSVLLNQSYPEAVRRGIMERIQYNVKHPKVTGEQLDVDAISILQRLGIDPHDLTK